MVRVVSVINLLVLLAPLLWAEADPAHKIDGRIFAGRSAVETVSFLVVLRRQADLSGAAAIGDRVARRRFVFETLRAHAEATQTKVRQRLERAGVPFRPHFLVNMIEVEGDQALALELGGSDEVSAIERNAPATLGLLNKPRTSPRSATTGIEPNIQKIHAPQLWDRGFTGQGVVIGSADTGFQWDHPALKNQYRGWDGAKVDHEYNWHDAVHNAVFNRCGSDAPAPCDDLDHGTETSGLAVGDDGAGNQIGVAPGARLIGCRNMDEGTGTPARYTECFEWLLAPTDANGANPRPDLGADVINNSWYCPATEGCTDPQILKAIVENVRAAGIAVVVAAGNDGFACGTIQNPPAIYEAAITIGATQMDDEHPEFSSVGPVTIDGSFRPKPDLCAPGEGVRTSARGNLYTSPFGGTSASAPHVTGAIALLWSAFPVLAGDVDSTEFLLKESAIRLLFPLLDSVYPGEELIHFCGGQSGLDAPNPVFGWGRVDVESAYEYFTIPRVPRDVPVLPPARTFQTRAIPPRP